MLNSNFLKAKKYQIETSDSWCSIGEVIKYTILRKRRLSKFSADINKQNNFNKTPLFIVTRTRNYTIVKYLVEPGADINKKDYYGETSLSIAFDDYERLVKYLMKPGKI